MSGAPTLANGRAGNVMAPISSLLVDGVGWLSRADGFLTGSPLPGSTPRSDVLDRKVRRGDWVRVVEEVGHFLRVALVVQALLIGVRQVVVEKGQVFFLAAQLADLRARFLGDNLTPLHLSAQLAHRCLVFG